MPDVGERVKSRPIAVYTKTVDAKEGVVVAYPSVSCNVDSDGDVSVPGATAYGLQIVTPKGVWSHDWDTPVAKALSAAEIMPGDRQLPGDLLKQGLGGLRLELQFNMHPDAKAAREAFANVDFFADEQEWSVGYEIVQRAVGPAGAEKALAQMAALGIDFAPAIKRIKDAGDANPAVQFITKWITFEASPVLFGANSEGLTESVKTLDDGDRIGRLEKAVERLIVRTDLPGDTDDDETVVVKAGRVLSGRNEQRLRDAGAAIQAALDELAKHDDDDGGDAEKELDEVVAAKEAGGTAAKAYVSLRGSDDERRAAVQDACSEAWGQLLANGCRPYVNVEAMFDAFAVVMVEDFDGDSPDYWRVPYTWTEGDDDATLGPAQPIELTIVMVPSTIDSDDPLPTMGVVEGSIEAEDDTDPGLNLPALPPLPGAPKTYVKAHEFQPSADNARVCSECDAGASRPWHTKPAEDDDAKAAVAAADAQAKTVEAMLLEQEWLRSKVAV